MIPKCFLFLILIGKSYQLNVEAIQKFFSAQNVFSLDIHYCQDDVDPKLFYEHFKSTQFKIKLKKSKIMNSKENVGIFTDLKCLKDYSFTNPDAKWLIKGENYKETVSILKKYNFDYFSILVDDKIYGLYKSDSKIKKISVFNSTSGEMKSDLKGVVIKGAVPLYYDGNNLNEYLITRSEDPRDNYVKFCFSVYSHLLKKLKAKWQLKFTEPTETGKTYEIIEGALNYYRGGQFGLLDRGEADVSLFLTEQLPSGLDRFSFLHSPIKMGNSFVFKHPRLLTRPTDLLLPFRPQVWYVLAFISLGGALILKLMSSMEDEHHNEPSTVFNVLIIIGTLTQQGLTVNSKRFSKQIIQISILILSTLAYAFYNASLVILLLSPTPKYIKSVDMLMRSNLKLAAEDNFINKFILSANYSQIGEKVSKKVQFFELIEGIRMMKENDFALFGQDSNVYSQIDAFTDSEMCNLASFYVYEPFQGTSLVRKGFPFREQFSRGILQLKESGIIGRENKFWNREKPECLGYEKFVVTDLKAAFLAYIVILTGLVTTLVIFIIEILTFKMIHGPKFVKVHRM